MRRGAHLQPEPLKIVVSDLIDLGLIKAPTAVFGIHAGKRIEAMLTADGAFVYWGNSYSSPPASAGRKSGAHSATTYGQCALA